MTEKAEELSGGFAVRNVSNAGYIHLCVRHGTEGASGSSHFIKSLCSPLVFSGLCWPVSSNARDVNVIQQVQRDTRPSEDDGIGQRPQWCFPRWPFADALLLEETIWLWDGSYFSEAGLAVTLTERVLVRHRTVIQSTRDYVVMFWFIAWISVVVSTKLPNLYWLYPLLESG